MNFFAKIKNSIYSPKYYQELIDKPFSYSLKYYLLFSLICMVLSTVSFSVFYLPQMSSALNNIGPAIIDKYPQELEIVVKNGNVSINVDEPYYIKIPDSWGDLKKQENNPKNLIVIDTKSEPNVDNLAKYETVCLITKNYVIAKGSDGKIETQSLKDMPDTVLNKEIVTQFTNKYSPYLKLLIPIVIIFVFIGSFFAMIFKLVYLFFLALFIWLIASIKKVDIGYGKSYQMGIHLMTLPILLSFLQINFIFLFTTIALILAAINIEKKKENILA